MLGQTKICRGGFDHVSCPSCEQVVAVLCFCLLFEISFKNGDTERQTWAGGQGVNKLAAVVSTVGAVSHVELLWMTNCRREGTLKEHFTKEDCIWEDNISFGLDSLMHLKIWEHSGRFEIILRALKIGRIFKNRLENIWEGLMWLEKKEKHCKNISQDLKKMSVVEKIRFHFFDERQILGHSRYFEIIWDFKITGNLRGSDYTQEEKEHCMNISQED